MSILAINEDNFEKEVVNEEKPVLIDFMATWCGPCQMLSPIIENLSLEYGDKIKFCKINVDEENQLAADFQIASIPAVLVIKDKKVVRKSVGYQSYEQMKEFIEKALTD